MFLISVSPHRFIVHLICGAGIETKACVYPAKNNHVTKMQPWVAMCFRVRVGLEMGDKKTHLKMVDESSWPDGVHVCTTGGLRKPLISLNEVLLGVVISGGPPSH